MSKSDRGSLSFVLFATCVTALGGFLFGYDTAVINGANSLIKEHWGLNPYQEGLVGASAILGCIPGAMFAGWLSDRFGRKRMLFLCALLYGLSAVLFLPALTPTLTPFLIARFVCGLGIGASSMICPVYIAELAPEKWRGRLGTLFQLAIVVGIFLTLFVNKTVQEHGCEACNSVLSFVGQRPSELGDAAWNTAVGWRWMLGIGTLPAVLFFVLLLGVPESPRWLSQNNREAEARAILCRTAGAVHAEQQMTEIREAIGQEEGRFSELFGGAYFRPVVLAVVLMLCSQFCGINAIIYYSTDIFKTAGADNAAAFAATAWMGVINLIATLVAVACVDKLGRRPLLLLGTAIQTFALGMIGWMFFAKVSGPAVPAGLIRLFQFMGSMVEPQQAALFGCIILFTAAFAVSLGPIGWLFCSEVFPNRVRGRAMSVAAMSVWISCYIVAQTFPILRENAPTFTYASADGQVYEMKVNTAVKPFKYETTDGRVYEVTEGTGIGPARAFWIYGAVSLFAFIFAALFIPETKGRTLEQIERYWKGRGAGKGA